MAIGIGGAGWLGVAHEVTAGTYVAPAKFIPIRSESLNYVSEDTQRRPIRRNVDVIDVVAGNARVEGDVEFEVTHDTIVWFLYAMRSTVVKTGASAPYTYVFTPSDAATPPNKTMSITVGRAGVVFAYTGCVVGSMSVTVDGGMLVATLSLLGRDEATQSTPGAFTWPTTTPFGAGEYVVQIPTSSQVYDADTFTFTVEDNATPEYRLNNTSRGARFIRYGERSVGLTVERDFDGRADYDAFKALTAQSLTVRAVRGAHSVEFKLPVTIKEGYTVNLAGQGDLIRASTTYVGTYDAATSKSYEITVITTESIV